MASERIGSRHHQITVCARHLLKRPLESEIETLLFLHNNIIYYTIYEPKSRV